MRNRPRLAEIHLSKWRDPLDPADPRYFAKWLRALAGVAGCYAIRDNSSGKVLYCGMSGGRGDSRGDLYTIITRHFQQSMNRGGRRPAGTYYDRELVEVAITLTTPREAPEVEAALIEALRPSDNVRLAYVELDTDDPTAEELEAAMAELDGEQVPF